MLSERLKSDTEVEHQALEQEMMPLLRGATAEKPYAALLEGMYLFLAPLEQEAHLKIAAGSLPDLPSRRGTIWLAQDLEALGGTTLSASKATGPSIRSEAEAWGALYLLEGSTLGGQMITRMLQKQLPAAAQKLTYFGGYGAQTGSMWKAFKQQLNTWGEAHPEEQDAVVRFAKTAFSDFKKFLLAYKKTL